MRNTSSCIRPTTVRGVYTVVPCKHANLEFYYDICEINILKCLTRPSSPFLSSLLSHYYLLSQEVCLSASDSFPAPVLRIGLAEVRQLARIEACHLANRKVACRASEPKM